MGRRDRSRPARDVLRADWSRWTTIVEAFAHRRPSRRWVDPVAYGTLHRRLLAQCRAEADGPGASAGSEELESLVRPWLSPKTLAQADREILGGLLVRCRAVERRLGGRRRGFTFRVPSARLLLPATVGAGSCVLGALVFGPGPAMDWVRGWSNALWFTVRRSSDVQRLAAVALVVVCVSIRVVSRIARS